MKSVGSISEREHKLLIYLMQLPSKILALHGREEVPGLLLHNLCHEQCFNITKAAYFVDNPDFNCCKGVAGYCKDDVCINPEVSWQQADMFSDHLRNAPFNQNVRGVECVSVSECKKVKAEAIDQLAKQLGMSEPRCCVWHLKNDNHGILLYEPADQHHEEVKGILEQSLYLFGFCPIH